jgi:iron complex transport system permease protein
VGLLVGAAFGMSGALFQTMTRNPLASPDLIGITAGAETAVVAGIVLAPGSGPGAQTLGLAGGLATALLIYLLAWRRGTTGYRIVLVGIGVSWMCVSATEYLLTRARLHQAQEALGWLVGDLNSRGWEHVRPLAAAMALLVPVALLLGRRLRTLQLGDEVAAGLGVPVQRDRLALLLTGVGLIAFGTAAAGPIAFVAFLAGPIAARIVGAGGSLMVPAALVGSLLVLVADLVGQHAFGNRYPVGVVTGVLGAPYLIYLLIRTNRAGGSL